MAHHFTKNTVQADAWCLKCGKRTMHRVDDGRIGPCLICMEKLESERTKPKPEPAKQESLF